MPDLKSIVHRRLSQMKGLPYLKMLSPVSAEVPSEGDLEGFKKAQRLGYQCCLEISEQIQPGWTERQTADLMDSYLGDFGVRAYFHKSFAWFGERSRFQNFTNYFHFLPTQQKLKSNDVIILDTAPIVQGYTGDVGYTFSLEPHGGLEKAKTLLGEFRKNIPGWFAGPESGEEILKMVDERLKQAGYDNCHSQYPFGVLGHRVHKIPFWQIPGLVSPFTLHSYWALFSRGLFSELLSPYYQGDKGGLWAIEPHLGGEGFGAKFEEILVVGRDGAHWLDNEVPHNDREE